jgi:hypothetical protein
MLIERRRLNPYFGTDGQGTTPNDPSGQTPNGSTNPGQTPPTPNGQTPNGQKTPLNSLPQDVQEYIKSLRKESESSREQLDARSKQDQAAEEQRQREQGEFQKLADKYKTRVEELEQYQERYGKLAEQLSAQIKAQIKGWPAEVKALDPGDEAPIEDRLSWVERVTPLVARLEQQTQGQRPGNGPDPKPSGGSPEETKNHYRQKLGASGRYAI